MKKYKELMNTYQNLLKIEKERNSLQTQLENYINEKTDSDISYLTIYKDPVCGWTVSYHRYIPILGVDKIAHIPLQDVIYTLEKERELSQINLMFTPVIDRLTTGGITVTIGKAEKIDIYRNLINKDIELQKVKTNLEMQIRQYANIRVPFIEISEDSICKWAFVYLQKYCKSKDEIRKANLEKVLAILKQKNTITQNDMFMLGNCNYKA